VLQLLLLLGAGLVDTSGVGPARRAVRLEIAVEGREEVTEIFVETWIGGRVRVTRRATPRGIVQLPAAELGSAERLVVRSIGFRPLVLRPARRIGTTVLRVRLEACRLALAEGSGARGVGLVYHPKAPLCSGPPRGAMARARSPAV
jgi:hypothetical protein